MYVCFFFVSSCCLNDFMYFDKWGVFEFVSIRRVTQDVSSVLVTKGCCMEFNGFSLLCPLVCLFFVYLKNPHFTNYTCKNTWKVDSKKFIKNKFSLTKHACSSHNKASIENCFPFNYNQTLIKMTSQSVLFKTLDVPRSTQRHCFP